MHGNDDDGFLLPFSHPDFTNIPTGRSWGTDKNQPDPETNVAKWFSRLNLFRSF